MKSILIIIILSFASICSILGQSGWRADLRVYEESNFGVHELNVRMIVDLYDNNGLVTPQPNYKYEFFKRHPLLGPEWILAATKWGINTLGTHANQDSTELPAGKLDFYCKITLPDDLVITADTIRVPWYNVIPNQKKISGSSFGSIDYWYKGSFKDNNGLNEIYIPRYDPKVLQADINVVSNPPEKYNYWTGNFGQTYYNNFVRFSPNELLLIPMAAQFNYTDNATIRAKVDNYYLDVIKFKDPWLRDYDEQPFGIRNQGLGAIPQPLVNDENNLGISTNHQGVLQDQSGPPNWIPPYYSISIPSSIYLTQSGKTHNLYLQSWDLSGASLENENLLETGVVFTSSSGASVTANLKATQLSDNQNAYSTNSQRKFVRTDDGYIHSVHESMGHVWYETSINNGQTWTLMNNGQPLDNGGGENPSIDWVTINGILTYIVIVFQQTEPGTGYPYSIQANVFGGTPLANPLPYPKIQTITIYNSGYQYTDIDADPVVAMYPGVDDAGIDIVWHINSGLKLQNAAITLFYNPPFYLLGAAVSVTGTNSSSIHPSLATYRVNNLGHFYLTWEENNVIKYAELYGSSVNNIQSISNGDGFTENHNPSISIANGHPVVSWTGYYSSNVSKILVKETESLERYKAVVRVGPSWGSFTELGDNVNYVNNNSTTSSVEKTVFVWSEGTAPQSKWAKRTSGTFSNIHDLDESGIQAQVTDGADYEYMTAMLFNNEELPYYFVKSEADFSVLDAGEEEQYKITEGDEITYGRSGIVSKNRVEFVFNIGDVFVGDSSIKFINIPDTLLYNSTSDINAVARTVDFWVDQNTDFYFSNLYYVIRQELADTALTVDDQVNFKAELVKSQSGEIVGVFDNITYDKFNLEKYASISYHVDCSGAQANDYYLRLVVAVIGDADYSLSNIQSDNFDLNKLSFVEVSFGGELTPETYVLSQNYPNPFNPSTTIKYQIPKAGAVTLKVYDILGSEVVTLVDDFQNEGRYEVNFNAFKLASGVYLYRLNVNDYVDVKKMLLLK